MLLSATWTYNLSLYWPDYIIQLENIILEKCKLSLNMLNVIENLDLFLSLTVTTGMVEV
jgi:hypothetical protein